MLVVVIFNFLNNDNIENNKSFWHEEIEISCESCSFGRMTKSISIIVEPISLLLQLKRYEFDTEKKRTKKKLDPIICTKTLVFPSGTKYTLNSKINYIREAIDSGHYKTSLYDRCTDSFVLLDDTNVCFYCKMQASDNAIVYMISYSKDN